MASEQAILFAVGSNHNTAPVEVRERIYVQEEEVPALVARLKESLIEAVVLSTCNRTEIYGVTRRTDIGLDFYKDLLIDFKGAGDQVTREHFFGAVSCAACLQLFRVATGLDSRVVGDSQILGQIRAAYRLAERHGATGKIINQLFQRSFKLGKRARSETGLHRGAISVGIAAAEAADRHFGGLTDKTVMLVGAGDTARLAAEALAKRKVGRLIVANRTASKAAAMLAGVGRDGEVIGVNEIGSRMHEADAVITAVAGNEPLITAEMLGSRKQDLLLIDLGLPRNVASDVAELPGVRLRNVDDISAVVDLNYRLRLENVPQARRLITDEMTEFLIWYYSLPLLPSPLRSGAKPDPETLTEIVGVKRFLFDNLSWVHKVALSDGAETFAGHASVVERLVEMRTASGPKVQP